MQNISQFAVMLFPIQYEYYYYVGKLSGKVTIYLKT